MQRTHGPLVVSTLAIALMVGHEVSSAWGDTTPGPVMIGTLSIRVVELRSSDGQVGCALWSSERGFPKDSRTALQTRWCRVSNREALCAFDPVAAGTYAVACFHDENGNRVLDTGLFGIPKEGVAASRNARGFMGPPKFNDAKFTLAGKATELRLKVSY